jgi:hypothetical protein
MADEFDWGPLGEAWWRENGEAARASELQIKYACARHQGATMVKAATLAGYSGTGDQLRSAGSRAEGTTAVDSLLTLAAAAESGVASDTVTDVEIDRKLAKLIRNPDGAISLKAIEAHDKRIAARKQRGEDPTDDGFSDWRQCRDWLLSMGASSFMLGYRHMKGALGHPGNFPLLLDVRNMALGEPHGPQVWEWACQGLSVDMKNDLDIKLASKDYQLAARQKIWAERGIKIGANGQPELLPGGLIV